MRKIFNLTVNYEKIHKTDLLSLLMDLHMFLACTVVFKEAQYNYSAYRSAHFFIIATAR